MSKLLLLLILNSDKSPPKVTFNISLSIASTELPLRQSSLLCSLITGHVIVTCTHFPYKSTIPYNTAGNPSAATPWGSPLI